MFSTFKLIPLFTCVLALAISIFGCGSAEQSTDNAEVKMTEVAEPKAQVLLLTQDFPYDNAHKDSIAGPYRVQQQLTVPSDLGPQNKWVMFEGPVLENDMVAYRFYMDSRHRYDIYGKRVHDLVMDTVGWNYHDIMDWGSDILKVGNSLGMGTPAILYQGKLYHFGDAREMVVSTAMTEEGCAQVRTLFNEVAIGDQPTITLSETTTLCPGNRQASVQVTVENGVLPKGAAFCTGVVKHDTELQTLDTQGSKAVFSWGAQSYHGENMGMAVLAKAEQVDRKMEDPLSHLLVFKSDLPSVEYAFLSAWERDVIPVKTQAEFEAAITKAATH